ncbi:MAG: hypothetical protein Q8P35_03030 [Candidatus Yanofskybacteria bacterium]|nr:hypothetical protein [Candidatus Yanofskybacteria bacterium]
MWYSNVENFKNANGYEIDGVWYPRVTSILSIKAKPALYMYYAGLPSYKAGEAIKKMSAEEGTLLHNTIEGILKKEPVTIPDSLKPSVDAFLNFANNNDINPIKIEERIVSKEHHYAGTIDILAEVNGKVGILDIKTSIGIYRDYGMQTAAYIQAYKEDPSIPPLTSWVLRLDQARACNLCGGTRREKGGNIKIRSTDKKCEHDWGPVTGTAEFKELDGFDSNIKAFLAAKSLWEWENEYWLGKIK